MRNRVPRRIVTARRLRGGRSLALSLIVMVAAVGCGCGRVVRPSVKLGLVAPFEGRYRYVGYDVIYATRLALREVNSVGGVGGYNVELLAFDDASDPVRAVEQAGNLATDPALLGVLGHFRDDTTSAASGVYSEKGIPFVAIGMGASDVSPHVPGFHIGASAELVAKALLELVQRNLDRREAALLTSGGPLGRAVIQRAKSEGFRLVTVVSADEEGWATSSGLLSAAALLCDLDPAPAGEVMVALRTAGWEGSMLGGSALMTMDFRTIAGDYAEGVWSVTPWPYVDDLQGHERFEEAYRTVSGGAAPGSLALVTYEATYVLLEAIQRDVAANGVPTPTGLSAALGRTARSGMLGEISFDNNRNWRDAPVFVYRLGPEGVARMVQ